MQRIIEAPEVVQALKKAREFAEKAASAKTQRERTEYERLQQKWIGIADGWRVIVEVDAHLS